MGLPLMTPARLMCAQHTVPFPDTSYRPSNHRVQAGILFVCSKWQGRLRAAQPQEVAVAL